MKTKHFLMVSFLFFIGVLNANAQKWEVLGRKTVDFAVDHDEIIVNSPREDFKALKIIVTKAPINMHKCVVHFMNGSKQEVELRNNFTPGSESRVIDLIGEKRRIERISFWYDTKNHAKRRAVVTVVGH